MQLHDSEQKSGWAALAPLMAAYHEKLAEARKAEHGATAAAAARAASGEPTTTGNRAVTAAQSSDKSALSAREQAAQNKVIAQLKARDREVRAHEQAHMAVGGAHAGSASFTYQVGPDGKRYAIGGEVPIDVSTVPGDPQATIQKMEQVKAAALAPAEPSGADRKIAALADQQRAQALADLAALRAEAARGGPEDDTPPRYA